MVTAVITDAGPQINDIQWTIKCKQCNLNVKFNQGLAFLGKHEEANLAQIMVDAYDKKILETQTQCFHRTSTIETNLVSDNGVLPPIWPDEIAHFDFYVKWNVRKCMKRRNLVF